MRMFNETPSVFPGMIPYCILQEDNSILDLKVLSNETEFISSKVNGETPNFIAKFTKRGMF